MQELHQLVFHSVCHDTSPVHTHKMNMLGQRRQPRRSLKCNFIMHLHLYDTSSNVSTQVCDCITFIFVNPFRAWGDQQSSNLKLDIKVFWEKKHMFSTKNLCLSLFVGTLYCKVYFVLYNVNTTLLDSGYVSKYSNMNLSQYRFTKTFQIPSKDCQIFVLVHNLYLERQSLLYLK